MAVIDELIIIENGESKVVDSAENGIIDEIEVDSNLYHFAKESEVVGGVCDNAVEEPIIDLKISGNSVQNGEPTPEAPVEIESVGEKTKNLIKPQDIFSVNTTGNSYSELVEDGRNCVRYIDASDGRYKGFKFKENTQYTVSAYVKTKIRTTSNTASSAWINFFYTDGTKSVSSIERDIDWTYKELTSTAGKTVQAIGIDSVNYTNWIYVDVDTFQIEEGAIATDYEPYGYKVPVKVSGKNVLNIQALKESTETWVVPAYKYTLKLKPNTQYTCSSNVPKPIDDSLDEKCLYFNGVTWDSGAGVCVGQPKTTTTDENGSLYIAICKGRTYSEDLINGKYYIQIEEGTIAKDYEQYINPATTNIYLNEPLRKIGDFVDYLDYKNKKVVRNIKEMILTGDESWSYNSTYNAFCINDKNFKTGQTPLCTHLKGISAGILTNDNSLLINSTNIYIIRHDLGEDVNKLIDFLKSSNVKFINPLSTPTEETIDVPEITTNKGRNRFRIQTKIHPSEFKINYWKQIGVVEVEEEIIQNGSDILIIKTGATLTQNGSNLIIGE